MAEPYVSPFARPETAPPLDESLYSLDKDETAFFSTLSGISDEQALREHIIAVQHMAYTVYGYPCIRRFAFTKLKIFRLPAYPRVLTLLKEHSNPLFLDIGCCFGNDVRKIVHDGWPVENVIASDLREAFWNYGHELFKSTPETFPAAFIAGDAFDNNFLSSDPLPAGSEALSGRPNLRALTTLNSLKSKLSAIHASSFFHLFGEDGQRDLARRLATLLSSKPGSVIFGSHMSRPEAGHRTETLPLYNKSATNADTPEAKAGRPIAMYCHNPESWTNLWDGEIFEKGQVRVDAKLHEVQRTTLGVELAPDVKFYMMAWSVTRL